MTRDLRSVLEEFGEESGRALAARSAPDPGVHVQRVARRVVRRRTLRAGAAGTGVAVVALVGVLAAQGFVGPRPAPPALTPSPAVSVSPSTAPEPTPTPSASPARTSSEPTSAAPPVVEQPELVLGKGGAVAGFGAGADAGAVVAHLTGLFGAAPEDVNAQGPGRCPANGDPGASLRWGNVALLLRTRDATGAPVEPTVAGWSVQQLAPDEPGWDGPWRAVGTRTAEGLRLGETVSAARALYPDLDGGESWFSPSVYHWSTGDFPMTYAFASVGGGPDAVVTAMSGGYECGE
ncbi:hypothetical protein [Cellulomonas sp. NS3]|uniref:hypothetical protein n=1 Tax=Cellulomonas sp. NS3 TaxID=2973977 RepID=UPI002162975F|nr:hypothetical protein [Cellulomonas sp. NS3]